VFSLRPLAPSAVKSWLSLMPFCGEILSRKAPSDGPRSEKQHRLAASRRPDALLHSQAAVLDFAEQGPIGAAHHVENRSSLVAEYSIERLGVTVEIAGAGNLEFLFPQGQGGLFLRRQIPATAAGILGEIAEDVRQLESDTGGLGGFLGFFE